MIFEMAFVKVLEILHAIQFGHSLKLNSDKLLNDASERVRDKIIKEILKNKKAIKIQNLISELELSYEWILQPK